MKTDSKKKGIQAVDLGLSSQWATCNLGADSPDKVGDYFAWGETAPKSNYDTENYKWFAEGVASKYGAEGDCANVDPGIQTYLDSADDVAHMRLGNTWRIPNLKDIAELHDKCSWKWATRKGVKGYLIKSKVEGYTDRSIFLPVSGCVYHSDIVNGGKAGYYWTCELYKQNAKHAIATVFDKHILIEYLPKPRYAGLMIRPVCDKQKEAMNQKRLRFPTTKEIVDFIWREAEYSAAIINLEHLYNRDKMDAITRLRQLQFWVEAGEMKEAFEQKKFIQIKSDYIPELLIKQKCKTVVDLVKLYYAHTGRILDIEFNEETAIESEHCYAELMNKRLAKLERDFNEALKSW